LFSAQWKGKEQVELKLKLNAEFRFLKVKAGFITSWHNLSSSELRTELSLELMKKKKKKKNICPICGKPYKYKLETNYNWYTGKYSCKHD